MGDRSGHDKKAENVLEEHADEMIREWGRDSRLENLPVGTGLVLAWKGALDTSRLTRKAVFHRGRRAKEEPFKLNLRKRSR